MDATLAWRRHTMTKNTRCPDNARDHPNKQPALCLAADPRCASATPTTYAFIWVSRLIRQLFRSIRPIYLTGYPFRASRVDALTMKITDRQH